MAKPICTSPSVMRASHLPATMDAGSIGADAKRRSRPCSRSITIWTAPPVSSTSIVNMTIAPGMACE